MQWHGQARTTRTADGKTMRIGLGAIVDGKRSGLVEDANDVGRRTLRRDVSACHAHAYCIGFYGISYTSGAETLGGVGNLFASAEHIGICAVFGVFHVSTDTRYGFAREGQIFNLKADFCNKCCKLQHVALHENLCLAGFRCFYTSSRVYFTGMRALNASGICFECFRHVTVTGYAPKWKCKYTVLMSVSKTGEGKETRQSANKVFFVLRRSSMTELSPTPTTPPTRDNNPGHGSPPPPHTVLAMGSPIPTSQQIACISKSWLWIRFPSSHSCT